MSPSELIPAGFAELIAGRSAGARAGGVDGDEWLAALPGLLESALRRWELAVDGPSRHGECAVVVPVRRADSSAAALKVTWPHDSARHEHLALRAWGGRAAVGLLAAYPADHAVLLERLDPDRDLQREPIDAACAVLGGLLRTLDRPAIPQLDTLSDSVRAFLQRAARPTPHLPRRFVEQASSLATDLLGEPDVDARLVHTDLHYANVLAVPGGGSWRAIDPKPLAADPAYAVWPALDQRWAEVVDAAHGRPDPRWQIRLRLGWICEASGIDEDKARAWSLVRTVAHALWLSDAFTDADLGPSITLAKALQPDS